MKLSNFIIIGLSLDDHKVYENGKYFSKLKTTHKKFGQTAIKLKLHNFKVQ